jgi:hypothetical protein
VNRRLWFCQTSLTGRPALERCWACSRYRFGLAGIAELHADLYDETGDRRHLERALTLAGEILLRADSVDGGLGWTAPRPVFLPHPGMPARFTGILHGAAGPGLLFLKLDALLHGRRPPAPFADDPFGG